MDSNICIPINLDAFILNESVCEGGKTRIAPITQPDYVSLRLKNSVIQHDVMPHVDLHSTETAMSNSRISMMQSAPFKILDLKHPIPPAKDVVQIRESRLGVYLHWSLPRGYRAGTSAAAGTAAGNNPSGATANPVFRPVPNRWMVVRKLISHSPQVDIPLVDGWIVESDRQQVIEKIDKLDLEADITPFVDYDSTKPDDVLFSQAEKYIGYRASINGWSEDTSVDRIPKLSTMSSSNPLFADYTAHNANVFSTRDSFEYAPGKYLQQATCNYYVVGWHSDTDDGPLGAHGISGSLDSRIRTFLCSLENNQYIAKLDKKAAQDLKNSDDFTSLLCHGAIYNVQYERTSKPVTQSDQYVDNFNDPSNVEMEPVAIGMSPMDSILTFLNAHDSDPNDEDRILGKGASSIAKSLLSLSELLYATDDEYDSRLKATDLLTGQAFKGTTGGFAWHFDKKKDPQKPGPPPSPSTIPDGDHMSELDYLNRLNELQRSLDITDQMLLLHQWDLFAQFFNYCSDRFGSTNAKTYKDIVNNLYQFDDKNNVWTGKIADLMSNKQGFEKAITAIIKPPANPDKPLVQARKIANDPYFLRSDPTLMIAGIDSGWPVEYLGRVDIRFGVEVKPPNDPAISALLTKFALPTTSGNIVATITNLLNEASQGVDKDKVGFKTWTGQPFCPIFVEWEAVYYHIDWPKWDVQLASSPLTTTNAPHIRYVNVDSVKGLVQDTRTMSGRIMVLPQPTFSLGAIVQQVFSTAGTNLPKEMQNWTHDDQQAFVDKVAKLKFISGELTGFTDSLLTLATGTHVKPNVRPQGQNATPLSEAVSVGVKIGMKKDHFTVIDSESAKTPYGTLANFVGADFQPFKGVQHGQLALTKLNVVDKFGQAVPCPLPKPTPTIPPSPPEFPIHPCLADQLCPSLNAGNTLNTVWETTDPISKSIGRISPFIQITPAINQNARVNAYFLEPVLDSNSKPTPFWKTCNDWENPIFGWIIVNYADSALQFFTGTGIFYTSVHFGGQDSTASSLPWAPFATPPPDEANKLVSPQLVELIKQMQNNASAQGYLGALWDMIDQAIQTMPFPPSQYSGYANAIVGKPLALVNAGWWLELAQAPLKAQHTLGPLPGQTGKNFPVPNPTEEDAMNSYQFKVKLGDWTRSYDGLVCYWDTDNGSTGKTTFDKMFTYFPQKNAISPRESIDPSNFPTLTPQFIHSEQFNGGPGLAEAQARKFMVKTMLIDPYTPVHLYSNILPIKSLQLPGWTLEIAMKNMTAFFTTGPLLVTKDVPKLYDPGQPLDPSSWIDHQDNQKSSPDQPLVKLPIAGGKGMWNWLQPYVDLNTPKSAGSLGVDLPRPLYNSFEVGQEDGRLRGDPAPYTLLEGYLQLARPLVDNPDHDGS